jgi:pheromone shutdown-related protein TraB
MEPTPATALESTDVRTLEIDGRRVHLVGTAHISHQSAELVRKVIEATSPDVVCVELDDRRYRALADRGRWEALDLKSIIREKQLSTLIINLMLSAYQKRLGDKLGAMPGLELLAATEVAREREIPVHLCDRDVRTTLRRAWHSMRFGEKMTFLASGLAGVFDKHELSEADLEKIRQQDVLNELLQEMGKAMPVLKQVLLDERDTYLAHRIREAEGREVVAVVGAGHVEGIERALVANTSVDLEELEHIPPPSSTWRVIGWAIPAIILGSLAYIGWARGPEAAGENALFWILANAIPASIGALIAMAHPLTIIVSFVSSPLTSLTPVIGVGYVAAFVQAWIRPPVVKELQLVSEDVVHLRRWWRNKLLRILLVFILSSLGGVLGTYVGAYEILSNVF